MCECSVCVRRRRVCVPGGGGGGPYLVLLLRKLKHMQSRTHSSPRHTPTMMPVTACTSSSVRPPQQNRINNVSNMSNR